MELIVRKRLLGSTALLAVALTAQNAAAAEKINLSLGGYFDAFIVAGSQDEGAGQSAAGFRGHGIGRESEIFFRGSTTLDNGIKFGVNIQLEGETSADQIDESYIFAEGGFGRIELGSEDPATDAMHYGAPNPIGKASINSPDNIHIQTGGNAAASPATIANISGDNDKITYFTPRFGGFQLGASYTPDATEEAAGALRAANTAGQQSEIVEVAINYEGSFGEVGVNVSGAYAAGDLEVAAAGAQDQEQWAIGASVTFGGFEVGAAYRQDDLGTTGTNTDREDIAVGISYGTGPWTIGAQYAIGEVEAGAAGGKDTSEGLELGAVYNVGPGIDLTGGVQFWNLDDNLNAAANENDATIFIIGTNISF